MFRKELKEGKKGVSRCTYLRSHRGGVVWVVIDSNIAIGWKYFNGSLFLDLRNLIAQPKTKNLAPVFWTYFSRIPVLVGILPKNTTKTIE